MVSPDRTASVLVDTARDSEYALAVIPSWGKVERPVKPLTHRRRKSSCYLASVDIGPESGWYLQVNSIAGPTSGTDPASGILQITS